MSSLVPYRAPPAIARAHRERGYTSAQLEAHAAALERKARMSPPPPAPPLPPRAPSVAYECAKSGPKPQPFRRTRASDVVKTVVAKAFAITVDDMLTETRLKKIVLARQLGMWMYKRSINTSAVSLPNIGRAFVGRSGRVYDHTTVLHAIVMVDARISADPAFAAWVMELCDQVDDALAAIKAEAQSETKLSDTRCPAEWLDWIRAENDALCIEKLAAGLPAPKASTNEADWSRPDSLGRGNASRSIYTVSRETESHPLHAAVRRKES